MMAEAFDICDTGNGYEPCSKCGEVFHMGIVSNSASLAVECLECDHRGPEIEMPPPGQWETWPVSWQERDRQAWAAWNDQSLLARKT